VFADGFASRPTFKAPRKTDIEERMGKIIAAIPY
jgi:hypothetical protein